MSDEEQDRRRFASRLEAFSDNVFGFALAQSAFALETPKNPLRGRTRRRVLAARWSFAG